jgi:hypothetical protein
MKCVPGGEREAWLELVDGEWVPALDVTFAPHICRYRVEHLVAQYREGKELVVVEP